MGDGAHTQDHDPHASVPRSPLFLPALAFAVGSVVGGAFPLSLPALGLILGCGSAGWLLLGTGRIGWPASWLRRFSTALFLLLCLAGAMFHARLPLACPPPDDLRVLPKGKFLNPQWEGRIAAAPDFTPSPRKSDAALSLGRSHFPFAVTRWRESPYAAWRPASGLVDVTLEGTPNRWNSGETVRLSGPLEPPAPPSGPGVFDSRSYLAAQEIHFRLRLPDSSALFVRESKGLESAALGEKTRAWSVAQLQKGIEDDPAVGAILSGMMLGQKETVSPWVLSEFRTTGTYHLFAVSGGNLVLLAGLLIGVLRFGGLISWRWGWMAIPLLYLYVVTTGNQASIIRAFLAAVALFVAWRIGRPVSPLNFWSLTLLGLLALRPAAALDLGFQLSFAIVLALILFAAPLDRLLRRPFALDPFIPLRYATPWQQGREHVNRTVCALLAASLVAWLGVAGLELFDFHQLCLVSVPANFIAVPLGGLIFTVGFLTLLLAPISSWLGILLNNANWLFVKALLAWVSFMAHLPHASHYVAPLGSEPQTRIILTRSGYGTAALIQSGGKTYLLNPGNEKGYFSGLDPVRKYYGINRLDGLFLTQWTAPQGAVLPRLPELFANAPAVYAPPLPPTRRKAPEWIAVLRDYRPSSLLTYGDTLDLGGGLKVTALSPMEDSPGRTASDLGLVLLFDHDGSRLLYAGGIGIGMERDLLAKAGEHQDSFKASVLVQSRKEKDFTLDPEWLAAIAPNDVILISATGREATALEVAPPLRSWNRTDANTGSGTVIVTLPGRGRPAEVREWKAPER
ncbi:ComEC/Rec2-related protein [Verrucomicrobium sp. GAS474]|uniref:ComEC/Rec2 family competence protein n=1 Tax=Verrucomicrobium sp. GAS474 TaxID=1882831 RepID=UPI00087DE1AC|nr:ComEC/Rec2 family competence protein [Verrucomicrobium sp. GAS474]SDU15351.1 ComEC/Rec2-related protein [Verrucomicrobium sp. GAS474]